MGREREREDGVTGTHVQKAERYEFYALGKEQVVYKVGLEA